MPGKAERDIEKVYAVADYVAKLRRLADALETGEPFRIQIAGERVNVPVRAEYTIEHERDDETEEIEFQIKWALDHARKPEAQADLTPRCHSRSQSCEAAPSPGPAAHASG